MVKFSLILLLSMANVGDVDHSKAVSNSLSQIIHTDQYAIDARNGEDKAVAQYEELIDTIEQPVITYAVGEPGIRLLKALKDKGKLFSSYTSIGIHQYSNLLPKAQGLADHIVIPSSVLSSAKEKQVVKGFDHHTLTFAVPVTNPSVDDLRAAYENWSAKDKLPMDGKYIIVMLPGDAPNETGRMKYFTKSSAHKLFTYIHQLWKARGGVHKVIVENGPRTGKHDPDTGKVVGLHEYEKDTDPDVAVDSVSTYFIDLLTKHQIGSEFFNFAFEVDGASRHPMSVHNQLLYLAKASPDNLFVLPGEAVSEFGKVTHYLGPKQIVAFKPDSMSYYHNKIYNLAVRNGYVSHFGPNGAIVEPSRPTLRTDNDATLVARDIVQGYEEKHEMCLSGDNLTTP